VILWRVSNHSTLDGSGGLSAAGRWHTAGRRIVYCAPNPATARLEVLVHAKVDIGALGRAWRTDLEATRRAGDEWLRSGRTALFRVPSVIVPATWNVLMNPQHPESAQARIVRVHSYGIDPRLLR
jgi:RES domain-containing protein